MRIPRSLAAIPVLAVVTGLLLSAAPPGPTARVDSIIGDPIAAESLAALRLVRSGHADSVSVRLREPKAAARRLGDRRALARLLAIEGGSLSLSQHGREAIPIASEAIALGEALPDTLLLMRGLRARAYASGLIALFDDEVRDARRLLALAERRRDLRFHGIALSLLGFVENHRGELVSARGHLAQAAAELRTAGDARSEAIANVALGFACLELNDLDAARQAYQRNLAIARETNQPWTEAQTLNDLGLLEARMGDLTAAASDYRASYASHRSRGEFADALAPLHNLAIHEARLGHYAAAESLLSEGFAMIDARGLRAQRADLLWVQSAIAIERGQWNQAKTLTRQLLAMGDTARSGERVQAVCTLVRALVYFDSADVAVRLVRAEQADLGSRTGPNHQAKLSHALAYALQDRPRESLAIALAAIPAAERAGLRDRELSLWIRVALCERALGHRDAARAACSRAIALWERQRMKPADLEWRAVIAQEFDSLNQLAFEVAAEGEPGSTPAQRAAAAYDMAQRFKSRALLERMAGPGALGAGDRLVVRPTTLAMVQSVTLRPGELLLDAYVGRDRAWCFAITRDSCSLIELGSTPELTSVIALAAELLSTPPSAGAAPDASPLTSLNARLFARLDDQIRAAHTVLLAPDGPLFRVPPAALLSAVAAGDSSHPAPVCWVVPSASMFAALRARERYASPPPGGGLLAVAGHERTIALGGATREVRSLGQRFEHVTVRGLGGAGDSLRPASLATYDMLHFAGHTAVDDARPWRSAVPGVLEASGEPLRASTLAALRLHARLAVLSSCRTAGGHISGGEGVAGLSSAFIAAGVPTVVGTLWAVDDRVTERLMHGFYDELARGRAAGEALAIAQSQIRREPSTAHPFYWAGFVLIGEGTMTATLVRRTGVPWFAAAAFVTLLLAWIVWWVRGRARQMRAPRAV